MFIEVMCLFNHYQKIVIVREWALNCFACRLCDYVFVALFICFTLPSLKRSYFLECYNYATDVLCQ